MDLCMFSLFICSLSRSSFTEDRFSLLTTFQLVSGALDSWRQVSPVRTKAKKTLSILAFSMPFVTVPCPIQQWAHIIPSFPFAANVPVEALLAGLHIRCQMQFQMYFGFVTPPLHAWTVSLYSYNKYFPHIATTWAYNKTPFKKAKNRTSHFKFSFQHCGLQFYLPDL